MNAPEVTPGNPRDVLFAYFRELLSLNAYAMAQADTAKRLGRELDLDDLRARRAEIRRRFCTPRRRKTDDVVSYGLLDIQAYDPSNIDVVDDAQSSAKQALITVRNRALGERWRYKLVRRGASWLLDCMEFRDGRKWVPVSLH